MNTGPSGVEGEEEEAGNVNVERYRSGVVEAEVEGVCGSGILGILRCSSQRERR